MLERYNDVLTVAELQEILGIGRNMVYSLLQSGKISAFRVGQKKWRIPKASICSVRFISAHLAAKQTAAKQ